MGWAGRYAGDRQRGSGLHAPEAVNKLVFDLAVTPHCFSESDRFRYSFQTPDGTRYYLMDPVKKSKTPLWNNAKVAALSTLTGFPYDAQHLPIKRLNYTPMQSYVIMARGGFFSHWLLGNSESGADILELQRAKLKE